MDATDNISALTSKLSRIILSVPKRGWLPSAPLNWAPVVGWLRGRDVASTELEGLDELMSSVQALFRKLNVRELNEVLSRLSVYSPLDSSSALHSHDNDDQEGDEHKNLICLAFRRIRDRWPHHARSDLFDFFSKERISDLNVRSRVIILDALQQPSISSHQGLGTHIRRIIVATYSYDLIHLKMESDGKGNYHSLHKLVYRDIASEKDRTWVLKHLRKEAKTLLSHAVVSSAQPNGCPQQRWLKIISDVDDTFKCSGGRYPAGSDDSLPRSCLYPGITALYRELDQGYKQSLLCWRTTSWECTESSPQKTLPPPTGLNKNGVGNLVFLSARPRSYHDWSERGLYRRFTTCLAEGSLHSMPTALLGDLKAGARFVGAGDSTPLAVGKVKRFREFAKLWPECRHIFIGDNGQGDVRTAEIMSALGSGRQHPFFSPSFENDVLASVDGPESPTFAAAHHPDQAGQLPPSFPASETATSDKHKCLTSQHPSYLQVAYINRVLPVSRTFGQGDPVSWSKYHIVFIDTYIDAAIHAASTSYCCRSPVVCHSGQSAVPIRSCPCQTSCPISSYHSALMSIEGLRNVCIETIDDFLKLDDVSNPRGWTKGFCGTNLLAAYARELYRLKISASIYKANWLMLKARSTVTPPESTQMFKMGTRVAIRRATQVRHFLNSGSRRHIVPPVFGGGRGGPGEYGCDGVVVDFRSRDGIYVVDLIRWKLGGGKSVRGYFVLDQLAPISSHQEPTYPPQDEFPSPTFDPSTRGASLGRSEVQNGGGGGDVLGSPYEVKLSRSCSDGTVPCSWRETRFGFFRGDGSEHRSLRRRLKSKFKSFKGSLMSSKETPNGDASGAYYGPVDPEEGHWVCEIGGS